MDIDDDREAVLVVDDDEDGREWARRALARHTVITTECQGAWRVISQKHKCLLAVLVSIEDFRAGASLILLAAEVGIPFIVVVSETTPPELNGSVFSINGILASISQGDSYYSFNGVQVRDWNALLFSLTVDGPMIFSASIPYPPRHRK